MRVEGDDNARQVSRSSLFSEAADEVLVPAMNAIELAQREGAGPPGSGPAQLLTRELPGHAGGSRSAWTAARRFSGGVWGEMEQPGASRKRRPSV